MRELVTSLRNPEHTGENRCVPCTVVNVVISAAVALVVGVALATPVGLVALAVCLAAVYLRGYLVPGTPTLTTRYLPDRVLALFDKGPRVAGGPSATVAESGSEDAGDGVDGDTDATDDADAADGDTDAADGTDADSDADADAAVDADADSADANSDADSTDDVDPERILLDAGAVVPCEEVEDLCLDESFETAWLETCRRLRDEDERAAVIADLFGGSEAGLQFTGTWHRAIVDGERRAKWPSEGAAIADLAADQVLRDRDDRWPDLSPTARTTALVGLRGFAETCPLCDGPVTAGEETQKSCCRSWDVFRVACEDCDEALLELDPETYQPLA